MHISNSPARGELTRRRRAVFAAFVAFGLVLGSWAVHLPILKFNLHASTSELGIILLILGGGAFFGMQASGYAANKFGSGKVAAIGSLALSITIVPPLFCSTWASAAIASLALGISVGIIEVGANAAAVEVEREYQRPIMSSFHGMFSVGSVLGSVIGAGAFALNISYRFTLPTIALMVLILLVVSAKTLMTIQTDPTPPIVTGSTATSSKVHRSKRHTMQLIAYGCLAFLLLLTEGSAMDWSSLHAQEHLDATSSGAALALACFVSAMTIGRFTIDRLAERIGPARILRYGAALSIAGLIAVICSPVLPLACIGWAATGLGLSGCVPQVFTATGNLHGSNAKELARVVGAGYIAVLAGPAIIGWLADQLGINNAFILPIIGMVICLASANVLEPKKEPVATH
ncbi:MFS transporter [Arthrobacter sp. S41]|uniref:MFS transporter n=2 Tax=Micrococcaceae TaxID=1268 RepID=UPI001036B013|nr:MFS transporter [Arthrobacter sp. S41]TAP28329.1 MFS transporter [Arthrobacter sp. S41]